MGMYQEIGTNFEMDARGVSKAALLAMALGCALWAAPAAAQTASATRTFVSGSGSDSNPCTITAPCRSLQAAVNVTAAAGEVVILTPGGYGTVTISHSITIANDGIGTASISVPGGGTGITINAATTDSVQLRGLEIDGNTSGGNYGIQVNTVGSLSVVNCVIRHTVYGMVLYEGATNVFNSIVSDQGPADTENPQDYAATGIDAKGSSTVYVTNSLLSGNGNDAILAYSGGTVYVDHDTITGNRVGLNNNAGTIYSFKDNDISGNTSANTSGTVTTATPQ